MSRLRFQGRAVRRSIRECRVVGRGSHFDGELLPGVASLACRVVNLEALDRPGCADCEICLRKTRAFPQHQEVPDVSICV